MVVVVVGEETISMRGISTILACASGFYGAWIISASALRREVGRSRAQ
jgi:hypothetical protein